MRKALLMLLPLCLLALASTHDVHAQRKKPKTRVYEDQEATLKVSCTPQQVVMATVIQYVISRTSQVSIQVFDAEGREVATLENQKRSPGLHTVIFDRRNLPRGIYFCQVVAGDLKETLRLEVVDPPG